MTLILSGTDGLSDVDGTAATPAIRGTDTNTGIFFPAADTIAFSEGGVESIRLDSSGNVGIGTSSPTARLHVSAPDGTAPLTLNTAGGADSTRALNFNVAGDNYGKILVPSGSGGAMAFWTGGANAAAERARITSTGDFQFNSGYGSVATAYGCRAWVNFNGTGTVAIRASGNVTSITDNGTGDYTVNFTTAMPDANYSIVGNAGGWGGAYNYMVINVGAGATPTTTACRIAARTSAGFADEAAVCISVFR